MSTPSLIGEILSIALCTKSDAYFWQTSPVLKVNTRQTE